MIRYKQLTWYVEDREAVQQVVSTYGGTCVRFFYFSDTFYLLRLVWSVPNLKRNHIFSMSGCFGIVGKTCTKTSANSIEISGSHVAESFPLVQAVFGKHHFLSDCQRSIATNLNPVQCRGHPGIASIRGVVTSFATIWSTATN